MAFPGVTINLCLHRQSLVPGPGDGSAVRGTDGCLSSFRRGSPCRKGTPTGSVTVTRCPSESSDRRAGSAGCWHQP